MVYHKDMIAVQSFLTKNAEDVKHLPGFKQDASRVNYKTASNTENLIWQSLEAVLRKRYNI